MEISQKIRVDGEVNRARCMPQNPAIVGAKTSSCEVYVFDSAKQAETQQGGGCDPDFRLRGHDKEGYGLSWSPFKQGYLVSGSHDSKICLWDVSAMAQDKVLDAMHVYEVFSGLYVLFASTQFQSFNICGALDVNFWSWKCCCRLMKVWLRMFHGT